jgi:hypothetical protein
MPAQSTLECQHGKSHEINYAAILLTITVLISCDARGETSVNYIAAMEPAESAGAPRSVIVTGVDRATTTVGTASGPKPALVEAAPGPLPRKILKEVGKQTVDQPGHFLIAAAPIWASRYLVGVPWYGWAIAPLLAYREWLQWPSKRWWDPPLDWIFLSLGAVVATCRRRMRHRAGPGLPLLRRSIATRSSFRAARQGHRPTEPVDHDAAPTPLHLPRAAGSVQQE